MDFLKWFKSWIEPRQSNNIQTNKIKFSSFDNAERRKLSHHLIVGQNKVGSDYDWIGIKNNTKALNEYNLIVDAISFGYIFMCFDRTLDEYTKTNEALKVLKEFIQNQGSDTTSASKRIAYLTKQSSEQEHIQSIVKIGSEKFIYELANSKFEDIINAMAIHNKHTKAFVGYMR